MKASSGHVTWWPQGRRDLESLKRPDLVSLVVGERSDAQQLLQTIGDLFGSLPRSLASVGLTPNPVSSSAALIDHLQSSFLLKDLECLCWKPWLNADPLRFLKLLARHHGVIAVWPGSVANGLASFSSPGRRDYVSVPASGVTVLRPVPTRFPDEVPFNLERIP